MYFNPLRLLMFKKSKIIVKNQKVHFNWWYHFIMEANGNCKSIGKMCESTGWKKERWGVLIRCGPSLHALAMTIKVNRLLKQRREMDAIATSTERRESGSPGVVRYYEPKLFRYHIPFLACCPFVLKYCMGWWDERHTYFWCEVWSTYSLVQAIKLIQIQGKLQKIITKRLSSLPSSYYRG